ncbi:ATP-binding protein [Nocardiopsis sp. FR26]|uniref:ATP-binding protein n=1 Tax=Nocardiopsis sp. FR26 TaxID=2605987 RepID=UPI00135CC475|nr:ATP-binding protein [Nocardiopsis sp. FR26]
MHDYEHDRRAKLADWENTKAANRLALWENTKQPKAFAKPGTLHPDIAAWCDRFAAGETGNLIIAGGIGVGKTWNLWAIGRYLITRHHWFGRMEVATAYDFHVATEGFKADRDQLNVWSSAHLLGLDDVGAQTVNERTKEHYAGVINTLSEDERPIIATTNEEKLAPFVGDRAASRLRENATFVTITGYDRRKARQ